MTCRQISGTTSWLPQRCQSKQVLLEQAEEPFQRGEKYGNPTWSGTAADQHLPLWQLRCRVQFWGDQSVWKAATGGSPNTRFVPYRMCIIIYCENSSQCPSISPMWINVVSLISSHCLCILYCSYPWFIPIYTNLTLLMVYSPFLLGNTSHIFHHV